MSSWIELPCGCKLSECFVMSMCFAHADELQRKKAEDRKAYEQYVRLCSGKETRVRCPGDGCPGCAGCRAEGDAPPEKAHDR